MDAGMVKDVGKFCGNCLYVFGGVSFLSMLYAWLFQHALYMEFSWIFFLWIGFLLRHHSNKARKFTIGFGFLGLAIGVVLLAYGMFKPGFFQSMRQLEELTVFAVKIKHPSAIVVSVFIVVAYSLNLALLVLLMSKKAKAEFSGTSHEAALDPPVE
jgi:multisubunit Na+/H+ antiporter MnhC subunit